MTCSIFCYKHRKYQCLSWLVARPELIDARNSLGQSSRSHKETLENRQNNEAAQRERYYATIHKVALQNSDKIPGELIPFG